jgi:hypothetical protein
MSDGKREKWETGGVGWRNPPLIELVAHPIVPRMLTIFFVVARI